MGDAQVKSSCSDLSPHTLCLEASKASYEKSKCQLRKPEILSCQQDCVVQSSVHCRKAGGRTGFFKGPYSTVVKIL